LGVENKFFRSSKISEIRTVLKRLYISNYALIEELDVTFPGNLTIITGETGAGKSIFLEALGIALGNRADSSVLQNKSKKCIVEAEFSIKDFKLDAFFKDNELDADTEVILRREINSEGKSRAFVNDSPVTINVLKQLADSLIDIHSQHQTLLLNNSRFQFQLLDTFCGCSADTDEFRKNFHKLNGLLKQQRELLEKEKEARKEQDYLQFLSDELNQTDLDPDTFRKMEENCLSLENSESIKSRRF
jgi:DNA repair protein RecN (Recombination protein N)